MTPKDPSLEGTFWDKFWRPIRSGRFCSLPSMGTSRPRISEKSLHELFQSGGCLEDRLSSYSWLS